MFINNHKICLLNKNGRGTLHVYVAYPCIENMAGFVYPSE